ncbi:uncharacterized protein [Rhodnius prolixus]|uniref:Secreted protein n=1 Tax=Rhodnius prolixus TaxID=13249 RepID=A0A4P6D956_RHOPR
MVLLLVTLCFCFTGSYTTIAEDVSYSIDLLLDSISALIKTDNYSRITLPSINKNGLHCDAGVFSDLSTIHRTGNATIDIQGDYMALISTSLGLTEFRLAYRKCVVAGVFRRSLRITAPEDSVTLQLSVHHKGTRCYAVLNSINIDLQNLQVYTGDKWYNKTEDWLINWLIKLNKDRLLESIYDVIWKQAKVLSNKNFC